MFKLITLASLALVAHSLVRTAHAADLSPYTTPPPAHRSVFHAVPEIIQRADSGITLGIGALHQHYAETQSGQTLDTERGTLTSFRLGIGEQGDHFGFGAGLHYSQGNDAYDGALQSCTSSGCTVTPATATTHNRILTATVSVDYGFSPLPHLAVLPEVFLGQRVWFRDIKGPGAVNEFYNNLYYGAGLNVQYTHGPFVVGLHGRYGRTLAPHLNLDSQTDFRLGTAPVYSVGARATWVALPWLKVYVDDTLSGFSYGASSAQDIGGGLMASEPRSRTIQNVVEVGVNLL